MKHFSIMLLFPVIVAVWYKEYSSVYAFVTAAISALLVASIIKRVVPGAKNLKTINDIKTGYTG